MQGFLAEGLSLEQIGKRLGKHPSTVGYWLKRHGLEAVGAARFAPKGGLDREDLATLIASGASQRRIAAALGVSLSTVRYWLGRFDLTTPQSALARTPLASRPKTVTRVCKSHGRADFVRNGRGHYRCTRCRSERVTRRRRTVKETLIRELGGACALCGYGRYAGALEFHHLNPAEKAFGLSAGGVARSLERARQEAAKCILLCANCHAEVEGGVASLP